MTNRDRDSIAKLLGDLAGRLEAAPAITDGAAKRYADGHPGVNQCAHQAGGLEHVCRSTAAELRYLITSYLTPKPSKQRI